MENRRTAAPRIAPLPGLFIAAAVLVAHSASAEIVHSGPQNVSIPWVIATTHLDLDGDGNDDFALYSAAGGTMDGVIAGNQSVGFDPTFQMDSWYWDLVRVLPGDSVSATSPDIVEPSPGEWRNQWRSSNNFLLWLPQGNTPQYLPGEDMYAGVCFVIDPGAAATTHYGWIHVIPYHSYFESLPAPLRPEDLGTILEWAYESEPDTAIAVGAVAQAVPGPAPVLLLGSMAALGMVALRRHRKAACCA